MELVAGSRGILAAEAAQERGATTQRLPFERVYREHVAYVFRILQRLGVAPGEVEDAAQEVFLVVYRRLSEFDASKGSLRSWMYGVARGTAANRRRAAMRRDARERSAPPPAAAPDPEQTLCRSRAVAQVESFLQGLCDERRAVFELIDIEGMRAPEVAELLDVNVNTVYTRLRAARLAFKAFVLELKKGGSNAG